MNRGPQDGTEMKGRVFPFPRVDACESNLEAVFRDQQVRLMQFLKVRLGSDAEASDAAQSAFLRLWNRRHLLHGENLVALLFVTGRNISLDMLRCRSRLRPQKMVIEDALDVPDESANPERALSAKQDLRLILKLIGELPEKCRAAFISYKFEDKSYSEIADLMGITESMVRKYVLRATVHCAARFEQLEGWE